MLVDFIIAELMIWAAMIALLPLATVAGVIVLKYQARCEVEERLRTSRPTSRSRGPSAPPLRAQTSAAARRSACACPKGTLYRERSDDSNVRACKIAP